MRERRSVLPPGTKSSISPSTTGGITFFSLKAKPRKIIVVTETIEQASSGHMKSPPFAKNPITVFTVPGVSAIIDVAII
jgi:hypothetical protein